MPVKIFQQLREHVEADDAIPAENRAMFWFTSYARQLRIWQQKYDQLSFQSLSQKEFTKQMVAPSYAQPGFFYFYRYDAKLKKTLPYWDQFPFVLILAVSKDRFLGLNFHYLSYEYRARLFDLLYPLREGRVSRPTVRDIRMRLKVSYSLLKLSHKYKAFKPCLKEYLMTHVKSPLMKVGAREWDVALFLPVERFQKRTKQYVWRESKKLFS